MERVHNINENLELEELSISIIRRFQHEISRILSYYYNVNTHFKESGKNVADELANQNNNINAKTNREIDRIRHEYFYSTDIFPTILSNTSLLICISTFEKQISDYCDLLKMRYQLKIGFKDLSGQGIEKNQNFISKVLGIDIIHRSKNWSNIIGYVKIRNIIAHNGGIVAEKSEINKNPISIFIKNEFIEIDNYTIKLTKKGTENLIETINEFWQEMKKSIMEKNASK